MGQTWPDGRWLWSAALVVVTAALPMSALAVTEVHELELQSDGTVLIDGERFRVRTGVDLDTLTWVALDKPGETIEQFTATLHLPRPVSAATEPSHKFLVINGVDRATSTLVDPTTIIYEAQGIGPDATVSVIADFPKGYLLLPPAARAEEAVQKLAGVWVATSIALPLLGLLLLAIMVAQRLLDRRVPRQAAATAFPKELSPALASILYENKIEPEAIAATLVDLADRGFLSIFNKGNNFIIAKERDIDLSTASFQVGMHDIHLSDEELAICQKEGLRPFEKILLSKLFVSARPISSKEDVKVRIGHGLFSKKVAAIYEYLFNDASAQGYFVPQATALHRKYLVAGWTLFLVGTVGFVAGAFTLPDPKYFLLFWAGLIAVAYVVVRLAPYVPVRTTQGRSTLGTLLIHRLTLTSSKPSQDGIDAFFAGLPLAWALRVEEPWAARFKDAVFHRPRWYYSSKPLRTAPEFIADLSNLVEFVASSFSAVREKTLA
ncbi:DUF2207 domain-containing protein [Candidatus Berkelbacteria bacterium]|nr:DUF2207 domain-containing protein [Candidatus Berkelbacteria bacterium]